MVPRPMSWCNGSCHGAKVLEPPLHLQVPELEEPTPATCHEQQFLCHPGEQVGAASHQPQVTQAPLYGIDGVFETFEDWNNGTTGGLDVYEPWFQVVRQGVRLVDHLKLPGAPGAVGAAPVRREVHHPPPVQDRRALLLLPHSQVMGFLFGHIYLKSCCIFFSSIYGASFAEQYYSEV